MLVKPPKARISRRRFLRAAGVVGAGSALAAGCSPPWAWTAPERGRLARFRGRAEYPHLFAAYPGLAARIPWLPLVQSPTPVEPLTGLATATNLAGLWIKRDDQSSDLYGGNKVRKHAFLLADAVAQGADHVVTMGGIGSHHCCSTAAFGRMLGLETSIVQTPQPVTPHVLKMLRWDAYYGAHFHLAANEADQMWTIHRTMEAVRRRGQRPYFIWAGGSNFLGTLGFLEAGLELKAQIDAGQLPQPDTIYVAAGSCGSFAGLVAAMKLLDVPVRVVGVQVVPAVITNELMVRTLANGMLANLRRLDPEFPALEVGFGDIEIRSGYLGEGYGHPTPAARQARELVAETEGIPLETTYTAKTLAAMLDHARRVPDHGPLLFWNTYNSVPTPELPGPDALPAEYQRFFAESA